MGVALHPTDAIHSDPVNRWGTGLRLGRTSRNEPAQGTLWAKHAPDDVRLQQRVVTRIVNLTQESPAIALARAMPSYE